MTEEEFGVTDHPGATVCYAVQEQDCAAVPGSRTHVPGAEHGAISCRNPDILERAAKATCDGFRVLGVVNRQAGRMRDHFGEEDSGGQRAHQVGAQEQAHDPGSAADQH